jgi:rfaE bifunctional protein nucleotidyltransferase chain/domain
VISIVAMNKLKNIDGALRVVEALKTSNKKVVFTNGCFDIIHAGHVEYLAKARALGDFLVLGINSDKSVQSIKGPKRPIVSEEERVIVLSALEMVDMVVLFDDEIPIKLIGLLRPDIHVKGGDYEKRNLPEYSTIKEYGGEVEIIEFREGCSTTGLIEKVVEIYGN